MLLHKNKQYIKANVVTNLMSKTVMKGLNKYTPQLPFTWQIFQWVSFDPPSPSTPTKYQFNSVDVFILNILKRLMAIYWRSICTPVDELKKHINDGAVIQFMTQL